MGVVTGYQIGKAVLAALHLDDHHVQRIVIDIPCDDAVKVYVQKLMLDDEVKPLCEALKEANGDVEVRECAAPLVVDEKTGAVRIGITEDGYTEWAPGK